MRLSYRCLDADGLVVAWVLSVLVGPGLWLLLTRVSVAYAFGVSGCVNCGSFDVEHSGCVLVYVCYLVVYAAILG